MKVKNAIKKNIIKICPDLYQFLSNQLAFIRYLHRKNMPVERYPKELEKSFKKAMGKDMDIQNPVTYSEKIQWLKLYDDNKLRTSLTDKVSVREWIKEKIGEEYLIPIIGVYSSFDEIDFERLPERFVIKTNHSSGWNIIVKDKSQFDKKSAKKKINRWLSLNYAFWNEYELHYSDIVPQIIIEHYLEDSNGQLNDYKFLCFQNVCEYVWMDFDRMTNHKRNVYDMNWVLQPWSQFTYGNYMGEVNKPQNFEEMVHIANILCQGFKHVRVDLYNVDGKIYFGEMTFTNGSGFEGIYPEKYEYELGKKIVLPMDL